MLLQEVSLVMACCNTLMNIDGELVGDPLEKAAFLATGWQLSSGAGSGVCRGSFAGTHATIKQVQKFHFSSELKRMAVIVRVSTARGSEVDYVLAKGAPEVLSRLLGKCPQGYERAHRQQAARGGRVIALAAKQINSATLGDLKTISRTEVLLLCVLAGPCVFRRQEHVATRQLDWISALSLGHLDASYMVPCMQAESNLQFLGCAVFNTPLKAGSVPALKMLASSSHQLVMITGDAPLTACFTAREVYIVDRPVLILQCDQPLTLNADGAPAASAPSLCTHSLHTLVFFLSFTTVRHKRVTTPVDSTG